MLNQKKLDIKMLTEEILKIENVTGSVYIGGNANAAIGLAVPAKSGYEPIGIINVSNSHGANLVITDFSLTSNTAGRVVLRNIGSSGVTVTVTATILYCKAIWVS